MNGICNVGNYEVDCTKFGGVIYASDFYPCYNSGDIAKRIVSDWNFDKQCRKNIEERKRTDAWRSENGQKKEGKKENKIESSR